MRIVSQRVFQCYSSRTCWEWLFRQISAYFYLPPTWHVHLFTTSVKNQARLARKIVGSYSRVFTVYMLSPHHLFCKAGIELANIIQHDVTVEHTMLFGVAKLFHLWCSMMCDNVYWPMLDGYVKLIKTFKATNQVCIVINLLKIFF